MNTVLPGLPERPRHPDLTVFMGGRDKLGHDIHEYIQYFD